MPVSAVAWTQAQVVNSNSTSSGKETREKRYNMKYYVGTHAINGGNAQKDV